MSIPDLTDDIELVAYYYGRQIGITTATNVQHYGSRYMVYIYRLYRYLKQVYQHLESGSRGRGIAAAVGPRANIPASCVGFDAILDAIAACPFKYIVGAE